MSSFNRTNSGVSNSAKFHRTEFIVYSEGGSETFSIDKVINEDCYNKYAYDVSFWGGIFHKYNFNSNFIIKPLGSKDATKYFCEKIEKNEISNIIVVRDRDFDEVYNKKVYDSPYIIYTKGYSWENDVFNEPLIKIISKKDSIYDKNNIEGYISDIYEHFNKISKIIYKADVTSRINGIPLIDQCKTNDFFIKDENLRFDLKRFFILLKNKRDKLLESGKDIKYYDFSNVSYCPEKNMYGKMRSAFGITVLNFVFNKTMGKNNIYNEKKHTINLIKDYLEFIDDSYYQAKIDELNKVILQ
jgi:hypothetical protein